MVEEELLSIEGFEAKDSMFRGQGRVVRKEGPKQYSCDVIGEPIDRKAVEREGGSPCEERGEREQTCTDKPTR